MTLDYRQTIFLPQTDFPMKGSLPQKEPELLAFWENYDLSRKQRLAREAREKFILHDGPPYANGHLHMGHAVNKILKDVVNRSQFMAGKDVVFVPGWDCHGLPIEWKIEEEYRAKGLKKNDVPPLIFRQACREFAYKWLNIQSKEFQRFGLMGDWLHPYTTMDFDSEAEIVRQLLTLFMKGYVSRGVRPVLWSVVEETALAEAEVEYQDVTSPSITVRFPVEEAPLSILKGASIVIWTTTSWTLPGNRAIAYGETLDYVILRVSAVEDKSLARVGEVLVVAQEQAETFYQDTGILEIELIAVEKGSTFKGVICAHPLKNKGYPFPVPLLPGNHVSADAGTGFVHTAPGHGVEDFAVGQQFGLEIPQTVGPDGHFYAHVPFFAGQHIYKVNPTVIETLLQEGALLREKKIVHSYPHSWRSKTPLIYRTTSQWFVAMEGKGKLREKSLAAIENVTWLPASAQTRLTRMVESRPDWCISRQRAWGVPITLFVNKETGAALHDERVNERILKAVKGKGAEAWFSSNPGDFLAPEYNPDDFEQIFDILDVWFDSGVTHCFVLKQRQDLEWPASLYLEGSDQHRGWFQSSLLTSCALEGVAPYKAVLTHGFVVDEQGRKMSKSVGNVISPQEIIDKMGADILRLWVVGTDSQEDMRIGGDVLKHTQDVYRRLRNTLRYLLGALAGFLPKEEAPEFSQFPELEQWVCHRLKELDLNLQHLFKVYNFQQIIQEIHHFCSVDLSAFYFDIRKDTLYCDAKDNLTRRATRAVMHHLLLCLTKWLAPFLCFTAEEAWQAFYGKESSVHLQEFPNLPDAWLYPALSQKYETLRNIRRVITGDLERARAEKVIGSSLQAHPHVYLDSSYRFTVEGVALDALALTSAITLSFEPAPEGSYTLSDVPGVGVKMGLAKGEKCARCWKILPEVEQTPLELCHRCEEMI